MSKSTSKSSASKVAVISSEVITTERCACKYCLSLEAPYPNHPVAPLTSSQKFSRVATNSEKTVYKFRAECPREAHLFLAAVSLFIEPSWVITPLEFYPDIECSFTIRKAISPFDLLWIANTIVDAHVIVDTLELAHEYTGDRDYGMTADAIEISNIPSAAVLVKLRKGISLYVKSLKYLRSDARELSEVIKAVSSPAD